MKNNRLLFSVLMLVLMSCTLAISRDVAVYVNGGRPWFAAIDVVCGILFHAHRRCVIAKMPIEGDTGHMTVSHRWRGNYQFRIWIPNEVSGITSAAEKLGMQCTFVDKKGKIIFVTDTQPSSHSFWKRNNRDMPQGSEQAFRMYRAPDDVPLDDDLTVMVKIYGEFDKFHSAHRQACLIVVKERDK